MNRFAAFTLDELNILKDALIVLAIKGGDSSFETMKNLMQELFDAQSRAALAQAGLIPA